MACPLSTETPLSALRDTEAHKAIQAAAAARCQTLVWDWAGATTFRLLAAVGVVIVVGSVWAWAWAWAWEEGWTQEWGWGTREGPWECGKGRHRVGLLACPSKVVASARQVWDWDWGWGWG